VCFKHEFDCLFSAARSFYYDSFQQVSNLTNLKHITVSERNYHILKRLGTSGDSFNDVVTEILKRLQQAQSLPTQGQIAVAPIEMDSNG
jgi:hypothetical protein